MPGALFDIGGVFVTDGPDMAMVSRELGHPESDLVRVAPIVRFHRDAYDLGLTDREYWDRVAADLGDHPYDDAIISRIVAADRRRWGTHRADTVALADELADKGWALGILSNAPRSLSRAFSSDPWAASRFAAFTFSCDLGYAKPDPRIYAAACDAMGLPPSDVVFLDDRPVNIEGARAAGLRAVLWTTAADARHALAD